MKLLRQVLTVVGLVLGLAVSTHGEPLEFSGYISSSTGTKLLLTDLGDGTRSGWLVIGGSFRGYTLNRFDAEQRSVSVTKEARTIQLPLKEPKAGDVAALLRDERTISFSDEGDFYIGDFAVDANTLAECLLSVAHAQPDGMIQLKTRWTNPGGSDASIVAKHKNVVSKLLAVVRTLGTEARRFQFETPKN